MGKVSLVHLIARGGAVRQGQREQAKVLRQGMNSSLVLLPTYNERENLSRVLPRLSRFMDTVDVLVIDDASPDGTGDLADFLSEEYPHLSVLHRRMKEGLGRAYIHGMKEALRRGYSRIITMDADLSHAPEDVPRLLEALEHSEVAVGSRHAPGGGVEGWPLSRRVLSRAGSFYARSLLGIPASDTTSGFRAYRSEALLAIDLDSIRSRGFAFQVEILRRILDVPGARVREVPVLFTNRRQGSSKLTGRIILEAAAEVLRIRVRRVLPARQGGKQPPLRASSPTASVVVPLLPDAPEPSVVEAFNGTAAPKGCLEILLARGHCPSKQRNKAAKSARGDLLLFLDDDSTPAPNLIETYTEMFRRNPEVAAMGGPAIYQGARFAERLSAAVLSEPMVTGRRAARYSRRGSTRPTDDGELILCNLAVRREAFAQVGGFEETLYPNEENLLLERLRERGERIWYLPSAVVTRPAPKAGRELLGKVFRYGRGRATQTRRHPSGRAIAWTSLALTALALPFAVLALLPWSSAPLLILSAFLLTYYAALLLRISSREGLKLGLCAPLAAAAVHLAYTTGLTAGFFWRLPAKQGTVTINILTFGHLEN